MGPRKPDELEIQLVRLTDTEVDTSVTEIHSRAVRRPVIQEHANSWYPEIIGICFSLACLIAIFAVLFHFHGEEAPHTLYGLTLNVGIVILGTAAKVSLVFAVSNALGQLKWIWFAGSESRKLIDATSFDDASGDPLGAIQRLASATCKSIGFVGAVLMILTLAYDPFVQQILRYQPSVRYTPSNLVIMRQTQFISQNDSYFERLAQLPATTAIGSAFITEVFELALICPSGNCT